VRQNDKGIGLQDLVEGFLFSLQAEGRALRTHEYYAKLLRHLLDFSRDQCWPLHDKQLEPKHFRQFLSWVSSRSYEYYPGNGSRRLVKSKPSTAWPYYKAMRRMMAAQAEAERERRAKIIHADGEFQASERLAAAGTIIAREPVTLHLRYLQTLTEIAREKNRTVVFPLPIDLLKMFM
jgi:hypothetical protein